MRGWSDDPFRRHQYRWFSLGRATSLVRDDNYESYDPPVSSEPTGTDSPALKTVPAEARTLPPTSPEAADEHQSPADSRPAVRVVEHRPTARPESPGAGGAGRNRVTLTVPSPYRATFTRMLEEELHIGPEAALAYYFQVSEGDPVVIASDLAAEQAEWIRSEIVRLGGEAEVEDLDRLRVGGGRRSPTPAGYRVAGNSLVRAPNSK